MFPMKRATKSLFGILLLSFLFLQSCSKSETLSVTESLASYVENEESVLVFGSVDLMSVLDKADYSNVPKFGPIVQTVVKDFESSLNLKAGLFYALQPDEVEGFEKGVVICFIEVNHPDSLAAMALEQGYDVEESGDLRYFRDNDVSLCLKDKLAAILVKNGDFDEKIVLADIMEKSQKGTDNKELLKLSQLKGELHVAYMMERTVTINAASGVISPDKLKQLKELQKDSYQEMTLYAEEGQIRIAMEGIFNSELKKRLPFKQDKSAEIRKKLGSGKPIAGFALNMDTRKMQSFFEDFSPVDMKEFTASLGGPFQLMMMIAGGKVSNVIDGQLGAVAYSNSFMGFGGQMDLNAYAQFGPNGEAVANMATSGVGEELKLKIDKEALYLSTSGKFDPDGKGIEVPQGCESFGKHGLTFFANMEAMDMTSFELEGGAKLLYLVKYINAYFDADQGEILIKLKKNNPNALKQVSAFMLEEFASQISNISI